MTDPAESLAAIGREWMSIGGSTMSKLRDLQVKRMTEIRDSGMSNLQRFFSANDPEAAEKMREELLAKGWEEHMAFVKAAIEIFDGAWNEMQEAVKTHAEIVGPDTGGSGGSTSPTPPTLAAVATLPASPEAAHGTPSGLVFELYKDQAGEFRFRLNDADGACMLRSEGYKARGSAENGIASIIKNAPNDARYDRTRTVADQPMFNLKAGNHQVIGTSGAFPSESEMEAAIQRLQSGVATAQTKDLVDGPATS